MFGSICVTYTYRWRLPWYYNGGWPAGGGVNNYWPPVSVFRGYLPFLSVAHHPRSIGRRAIGTRQTHVSDSAPWGLRDLPGILGRNRWENPKGWYAGRSGLDDLYPPPTPPQRRPARGSWNRTHPPDTAASETAKTPYRPDTRVLTRVRVWRREGGSRAGGKQRLLYATITRRTPRRILCTYICILLCVRFRRLTRPTARLGTRTVTTLRRFPGNEIPTARGETERRAVRQRVGGGGGRPSSRGGGREGKK